MSFGTQIFAGPGFQVVISSQGKVLLMLKRMRLLFKSVAKCLS